MSFVGPSQFKVKEVKIFTKQNTIDVSAIFEEINIYDSIFLPVISGNIVLSDSLGLTDRFNFDGSEFIQIYIKKDDESEIASFKKKFILYKQSKRENKNMSSEFYTLHFISEEYLISETQKLNHAYENTYTEIVKDIMKRYLLVPPSSEEYPEWFDNSIGIKKLVIPNLTPIDAIMWCSKRAVDEKRSPNFLFFQNLTGFKYTTLSKLHSLDTILKISFSPKNVGKKEKDNPLVEVSIPKKLEVIRQINEPERIRAGVNAGKFIGFDPMTSQTETTKIDFYDHYNPIKHLNKNPNIYIVKLRNGMNFALFDSKKTLSNFGYPTRKESEYIKKNDPDAIYKINDTENNIFQRRAIFKHLMTKKLKFVMPGNFQLSSGFNIETDIPIIAIKDKGSDNRDMGLSGKYIITSSRQIIRFDRHETIIEVCSSSTIRDV